MVLLHLFDMSNLRFMLLFVFGWGGGGWLLGACLLLSYVNMMSLIIIFDLMHAFRICKDFLSSL